MSSLRSPRSSRSSTDRGRAPRGAISGPPASGAAALAQRSLPGSLWALVRARLDARRADDEATAFAVAVLVASRLIVWVAGMWAIVLFGINPALSAAMDFAHVSTPFGSHATNLLFAPTVRWDAVWYLDIAGHGYFSHQATAFFPLLPLLLRGGAALFGSAVVAGSVISLIAMTIAGALLYRLARLDLDARAAGTTVALVAVFPTSFFLSAVYTESLFLALSLGAFYAARRERWLLAGVLGGFAGATRNAGILLLVPLVLMYLYGPRDGGVPVRCPAPRWLAHGGRVGVALWPRFALVVGRRMPIAGLVLVPAGLLAYCAYLAIKLGAPLAPFAAEHVWGRSFAGPFGGALRAIGRAPTALGHVLGGTQRPFGYGSPLGWDANQLIDLPFLAFAVAGLWMCWRRLSFAYFAYALVLCFQALSYPVPEEPLQSFSRYLLVMFPIFMGWGAWLSSRPLARRVALGGLTLGLVAFSALWTITIWVE
jgi:hypothetical protein